MVYAVPSGKLSHQLRSICCFCGCVTLNTVFMCRGTPLPNDLLLVHERSDHFSLQPARDMTIKGKSIGTCQGYLILAGLTYMFRFERRNHFFPLAPRNALYKTTVAGCLLGGDRLRPRRKIRLSRTETSTNLRLVCFKPLYFVIHSLSASSDSAKWNGCLSSQDSTSSLDANLSKNSSSDRFKSTRA